MQRCKCYQNILISRAYLVQHRHLYGSRLSFVLITETGKTQWSLVSERANRFCVRGRKTHPLTLFSTQPFHTLCGPLSLNTASAVTHCDQSTSSLHTWHKEGIKVKLFQNKSLSIETVLLFPYCILIKLMFKSSGVKQYLIVVGLRRQKFTSTIIS